MKRQSLLPIIATAVIILTVVGGQVVKNIDKNATEYRLSGHAYTPEVLTPKPAPLATPDPLAGISVGRLNAIKTAESYLKHSSFSRKGLVDQLRFEGYTSDEAVFACDYLEPDWYAEAAEAAASYMSFSSFSRKGLLDQLKFEGFTDDEAAYGVASVGY